MVYTWCIVVYHSISTVYTSIYTVYTSIYTVYTTHNEGSIAGFRGAHRNAAARVILQQPADSPPEQEEADSCPEPEDEEFFLGPDTESQEEAINMFLDGMEDQEHSGFKDIARFLG